MFEFIKYLFREIKLANIETNELMRTERPIKNAIWPFVILFRSISRSFKESMEELRKEYKNYKNIS